jgi:hypothetical protein
MTATAVKVTASATAPVVIAPFPAIVDAAGRVKPDLAAIPVRMAKAEASAFVSQFFWPTRPRTLEGWPVPSKTLNRRRTWLTSDLVRHCEITIASAPAGGSAPRK